MLGTYTDRNQHVLALTMYGEARGEGSAGMEAVGHVVMNRLAKKTWYGKSPADVCLKPYQFSCWNLDDPNRAELVSPVEPTDDSFLQAQEIAERLLASALTDVTVDATHYYRAGTPEPKWAEGKTPCAQIGHHLFFNDIG